MEKVEAYINKPSDDYEVPLCFDRQARI